MTYPGVDFVHLVGPDDHGGARDLHALDGDVYFILHHAVTTTVQNILATFDSDKSVGATFAIGPAVAGGHDILVALATPENIRPYTTASTLDNKALTAEVANLSLGGDYPVAAETKTEVARILAYMHQEYGMPLDRVHFLNHQEAYERGYGSYATACPGNDLERSMDSILQQAVDIVTGAKAPQPKEDDMGILYVAKNNSKDGKIEKGISYLLEGSGPVRPLSKIEYDAVVWTDGATGVKHREVNWDGEDIRSIAKVPGLVEVTWQDLGGGKGLCPMPTGNILH